jgi:hypothetical protein
MSIYSSPLSSSEDSSQEEDLMKVGNLMSSGNLLGITDLFREFRVDNLGDMDGKRDILEQRECSTQNTRRVDKYSHRYNMRPSPSRSATPPTKRYEHSQNMKISAPRSSPNSAPVSSSRTIPHLSLTCNSDLKKSKISVMSRSAPDKTNLEL